MRITILAIGKKHDSKLAAAIDDYTARLKHYASTEWRLVEAKITPSMPEAAIRAAESSALLSQLADTDSVILLDERGKQLDSPAFAQKLQSFMDQGTKHLVLIIGGAYGVDRAISDRANFTLSLSGLVFPHQLVRLVLIEQLYRAHTILAGEKYHHA